MRNMEGKYLRFYENTSKLVEEDFKDALPGFVNHKAATAQLIPLVPLLEETTVIAIDVSSIKLGETQTGILCAVRGAIAWREKGQYRYFRLGPFPFHVTEENRSEIYSSLTQCSFDRPESMKAPSLVNVQTRIGTIFERWLQMCVSCSCKDNVILWDGSLTAGTVDSPVNVMSQLLQIARKSFNSVLAFSKMSSLRFFGHRVTDIPWECQPPCLLQIGDYQFPTSPIRLLGDIYVAKLTPGRCSFRLDIDRKIPYERRIEAIQKLLGNEVLHQSYPETLRLAHIFSTFTASEVIGIQRYIAQEWGLKIVPRPNVRRLLFGPFGKGPEG